MERSEKICLTMREHDDKTKLFCPRAPPLQFSLCNCSECSTKSSEAVPVAVGLKRKSNIVGHPRAGQVCEYEYKVQGSAPARVNEMYGETFSSNVQHVEVATNGSLTSLQSSDHQPTVAGQYAVRRECYGKKASCSACLGAATTTVLIAAIVACMFGVAVICRWAVVCTSSEMKQE